MKRIFILLILLLGLSACTAAPTPTEETIKSLPVEATPEVFKVAFVYVAPIGDLGWTWAHEQARLQVEDLDGVETAYIENVPEGPEAERIIRDFAQKDYNVIITTSFGFQDATLIVAAEYPDIQFVHISGWKTASNSSQVFGKLYQPRFLAGMAAADHIGDGHIGMVAAFAIPEVIRNINALQLGCQALNSDCTTTVVWSNTWFDPPIEKEAAEALVSTGATVLAQYQDTTETQKVAKDNNLVGIGNDSDMAQFVGDTVLTTPIWDWGPKYIEIVEQVRAGTYNGSEVFNGGMETGIVQMAPLNRTSPETTAKINAVKNDLENRIDKIFCGPITGANGNLIVEEGKCLTDKELSEMDYPVDGVQGDFPGEAPEGIGE